MVWMCNLIKCLRLVLNFVFRCHIQEHLECDWIYLNGKSWSILLLKCLSILEIHCVFINWNSLHCYAVFLIGSLYLVSFIVLIRISKWDSHKLNSNNVLISKYVILLYLSPMIPAELILKCLDTAAFIWSLTRFNS